MKARWTGSPAAARFRPKRGYASWKEKDDMAFVRRVEPEWIDQLPADDPRASRSRRDLVRVNAWMMQPKIVAEALLMHQRTAPRTILDLGGGDGAFALELARRLAPRWPDVTVTVNDLHNIVSREIRAAIEGHGWTVEVAAADVFECLKAATPQDITIANLFLHHFQPEELARLMPAIARISTLFVASDPRRTRMTREVSRFLWLVGCNRITIRDAMTSVRAGFHDHELSALWPDPSDWELHESDAGLFSHCFVARRR